MNNCTVGYTGLLCLECEKDYYKIGFYYCMACDQKKSVSTMKFIFTALFLICFILIFCQYIINFYNFI